jgi:hypothetical protein
LILSAATASTEKKAGNTPKAEPAAPCKSARREGFWMVMLTLEQPKHQKERDSRIEAFWSQANAVRSCISKLSVTI